MSQDSQDINVYKSASGLIIKKYPNINLKDYQFVYGERSAEFTKRHNEHFGKIATSETLRDIDQQMLDAISGILEIAKNKLNPSDAQTVVTSVNNVRVAFAKKYEILFDYIEKLENAATT